MSTAGPTTALRWVRGIGAVLIGFIAAAILDIATDMALQALGLFAAPDATYPFALALFYRCVYAVFGAWLAARLAPSAPMLHALVLGALGFAASLAGFAIAREHPEMGPLWYAAALVVTALPCAWLGGVLQRWRPQARSFAS
jgi:hypothetical protein